MTTTTAPLPAARRHRSALIWVAVLALAGVPAIWLPFAWNTSPAHALFDGYLWTLAWPCLLAIPIAAALLRWVASGRLSTAEQWCGRLLAAAAVALTGWIYVRPGLRDDWPSGAHEWLTFSVPLAVLVGWAFLAVRAWRRRGAPQGLDTIVLMEVAYLANAVFCLLSFAGDLAIGGYTVLLTSVVYGIHSLASQVPGPAPS